MYAIKVFSGKKDSDWFFLRDTSDFVVYCWSERREAEIVLSQLENENCEITEDIPTSILTRFNEKRDSQKFKENWSIGELSLNANFT